MNTRVRLAALIFALTAFTFPALAWVDSIALGDPASEKDHCLTSERSEVIHGALDEPARRLLPVAYRKWHARSRVPQIIRSWAGGSLKFTVQVDPDQLNYTTLKLWGSDATLNLLVLFCDGKQIGYRYLGDLDVLDTGGDDGAAFPGRFIYNTTPLPLELTRGKTNLTLELRSAGPIWGYATTFAAFQNLMTAPTRGLYQIYIHTNGCFVPPADEQQGDAPKISFVRKEPGTNVLDQVKELALVEVVGDFAVSKVEELVGFFEIVYGNDVRDTALVQCFDQVCADEPAGAGDDVVHEIPN